MAKRTSFKTYTVTNTGKHISRRGANRILYSHAFLGNSYPTRRAMRRYGGSRATSVNRVNIRTIKHGRKAGTTTFGIYTVARQGGQFNPRAAQRARVDRNRLAARVNRQIGGNRPLIHGLPGFSQPYTGGRRIARHGRPVARHRRTYWARDSRGRFA